MELNRSHADIGYGELTLLGPEPDKARISNGVFIDLTGNVTIGANSEIAENVRIYTHKHHWVGRGLRKDNNVIDFWSISIGNDAFIGANSILIGARIIGDGAIIGAGSIVTRDVPPYEVWAGNPAKKIGER